MKRKYFKNELEEKSNVIQQIIEMLCFWNFAHILWNKSSQFSRVLKNWRNTHRTTPVHVVETLHIDQLLQNSFLHFGISVENFVMDWFYGSSVAMLRDEIKIIELGYNFVIDQSAKTWIRNISVSREEFLFRMFVSSHKCQFRWVSFHLLEHSFQLINFTGNNTVFFTIGNICLKDDDLVRHEIVEFSISCQTVSDCFSDLSAEIHIQRLVMIVWMEFRHLFVDGSSVTYNIVLLVYGILAKIYAYQHCLWVYTWRELWCPWSVSHLTSDLDENFG